MNNKILYLIISLLLCVSVFLAYQVSQASPAIPNPGHGTSDIEGDAFLNMNSNKIIGLATPSLGTDAATKTYVDSSAAGAGPTTPACVFCKTCGGAWPTGVTYMANSGNTPRAWGYGPSCGGSLQDATNAFMCCR